MQIIRLNIFDDFVLSSVMTSNATAVADLAATFRSRQPRNITQHTAVFFRLGRRLKFGEINDEVVWTTRHFGNKLS